MGDGRGGGEKGAGDREEWGRKGWRRGRGRRRGRVPSLSAAPIVSSPHPAQGHFTAPRTRKALRSPVVCGCLTQDAVVAACHCRLGSPGVPVPTLLLGLRYLAAAPTKWACARRPLALPPDSLWPQG